ncbi:MAG: 5-formyltetrahydrofolate cyclo-ligase [Cellvibrio sp. 79]|nr:MAG: 5-formyltetrahydrofolate cyclo-ligase [Cellvibrio sp. 79]
MADVSDLTPSNNDQQKALLRKELRQRRRALTPTQQTQASALVLRHLMRFPAFMRGTRIALYIANDGEMDPAPIARQLWQMNKYCYLPVLRPGSERELWFVEFTPNSQLIPNRFGIPEPDHGVAHKLPTHLLDVVLMPLVGFDRKGSRLGMGGGFYDTTFAFKHDKPLGKPLLIGLAHSCQEVDELQVDNWDIPLAAIATDKEVLLPHR